LPKSINHWGAGVPRNPRRRGPEGGKVEELRASQGSQRSTERHYRVSPTSGRQGKAHLDEKEGIRKAERLIKRREQERAEVPLGLGGWGGGRIKKIERGSEAEERRETFFRRQSFHALKGGNEFEGKNADWGKMFRFSGRIRLSNTTLESCDGFKSS